MDMSLKQWLKQYDIELFKAVTAHKKQYKSHRKICV